MNKILRSFATILALCCILHSYAQREVKFGYCNDTLSNDTEWIQNQQGYSLSFSAAIRIPGSRLQMLKGQKITRVRFACSSGLTSVRVWARHDLNDYVIGSPTKVGSINETGWHEVTFSTPIDITGEDLYIGYSGNALYGAALAFDGQSNPNGCYFNDGSGWSDLNSEGYPSLCIQVFAQVEGDQPINDLAVEKVAFDKAYTKQGETAQATVSIGNYGLDAVAAPKLYYSIAGGQAIEVPTEGDIEPNNALSFNFDIPTANLQEGKVPVRVWIDTEDNYKDNDTLNSQLLVYATGYPHKVLVEHFTTLKCVNCPIGHQALAAMLSDRNEYVWVAHHIGYGTDELTASESYALEPFGANFAPGGMFDRRALPASSSSTVPVMGINYGSIPASINALQPSFDICAETPAFVSVDIKNNYNPDTRELTTTVSGERNTIFSSFYDTANLTVELVEDKVNTKAKQTGSGETVHNNVFRSALTRFEGDEIYWNGNTYSETYTTTLPDTWNSDNVRVVAFVNLPFSSNDVSHADVLNANQLNVNFTTGINQTTTNGAQVLGRTYYNMQGQRISQPATSGAYIERIATPQGVQVVKHLK